MEGGSLSETQGKGLEAGMEEEAMGSATYGVGLHRLLSLLSYSTRDHQVQGWHQSSSSVLLCQSSVKNMLHRFAHGLSCGGIVAMKALSFPAI